MLAIFISHRVASKVYSSLNKKKTIIFVEQTEKTVSSVEWLNLLIVGRVILIARRGLF